MQNNLILNLNSASKSFFKWNKYDLKINGNPIGRLNASNEKITQDLEPGIYKLEVSEKNYTKSIEFEIESSKLKVITIKPKLSYNVFLGLFIGIALLIIVVKIIDFKSNTHSTFGLLVVLPLIFYLKKLDQNHLRLILKINILI